MICELEVLDPSGHVTLEWDPDDEESVRKAEAEFDRLRDAGFAFFTEVETFDPKAGKLDAEFGAEPDEPAPKKRQAPRQTRKFRKRARKTTAVPPLRGG